MYPIELLIVVWFPSLFDTCQCRIITVLKTKVILSNCKKCFAVICRTLQMDFLDTISEGVQVSRQELGLGQYRWTVTFLDAGDDFELEDVVSRNSLNASTGASTEITATKVRDDRPPDIGHKYSLQAAGLNDSP